MGLLCTTAPSPIGQPSRWDPNAMLLANWRQRFTTRASPLAFPVIAPNTGGSLTEDDGLSPMCRIQHLKVFMVRLNPPHRYLFRTRRGKAVIGSRVHMLNSLKTG